MPVATYRCSQTSLYLACHFASNSLQTNLSEFFAFRTCYTTSYIAQFKMAVQQAEALPALQARGANVEAMRIKMIDANQVALARWQALKSYISSAFPADEKPRLEAAGYLYYKKARRNHWQSVLALLHNASAFVHNHLDTLVSKGYMPATFQDAITASQVQAKEMFDEFIVLEQLAQKDTAAKIQANNALYKTLMFILVDGLHIFRNNESVKREFTLSHILGLMGRHHEARPAEPSTLPDPVHFSTN